MVELMDKWMAFNAKNTNCLKWGLYINSYSSQINWCCFFSVSFKKTNWLMSVFKCYWENAKRSWWSWGNFIFDFILFIQFVVTIIFFCQKTIHFGLFRNLTHLLILNCMFFCDCDWGSCRFIFLLLFFFFLLLMRNVSIFLFYFKICGNRCLFHVFISNLFTIWSYFAWICYLF